MASAEHKDFGAPDEVRDFEKARLELLNIGDGQVGRLTVEPGWRWSTHLKEVAGTELCEAPHFQYIVQGTVHVVMADGEEFDIGPGHGVGAAPRARRVGGGRRDRRGHRLGRGGQVGGRRLIG